MSRMINSLKKAFSKDNPKSPDDKSSPNAANGPSKVAKPSGKESSSPPAASTPLKKDGAKPPPSKIPVPVKSAQGPEHQQQSSLTRDDLLKPQIAFQSVPPGDKQMLFIKKLKLCSVLFTWDPVEDINAPIQVNPQDPDDAKAKEAKRQILLDLVDFVGKNKNFIDDIILGEIMKMVSINLFRALPSIEKSDDPEEEETTYEPSWPHLQIVYEFFLRFIVSSDLDSKLLKKHITNQFILNLLELFDSEDPRERDYLKTILHRIYAKFTSLRAFIRKAINNTFWTVIYETERHNGAAELLEILGSIINGFALPLKDEHKVFLRRVLIPMHKIKKLAPFHQQLSYCVTQFINKEAELAVPVIEGLLKLWPITSSAKEVVLLNEMEEILELTHPQEFRQVCEALFKQLARTIGSPHFQVAERALFLWQNEYISGLIADHRQIILPILYPVLYKNSQQHWNPTVHNLSTNVLKIFMDMDSALVQECQTKYQQATAKAEVVAKQKADLWRSLAEAAESKDNK